MEVKEPIHINDLCSTCGHFNGDTVVNNGYGCDHPDNEEWEYQYTDKPDERPHDEYFERYVDSELKSKNLKELGLKKQGKCFAFSCPISIHMDHEDWAERNEDPLQYDEDWVLLM